jgi:sugar transferase (PEP-CTERM/EpsH1 system associated)
LEVSLRILFLTQRVPYPPNRGDKIPNFHYIRHLAQEHEVVVACLADGRNDLTNAAGLSTIVTEVEAVPRSPIRSRLRALGALAVRNRSLTAAYFDEPELRRRVRRMLRTCQFDLVICCSSGMASFVQGFDVPKIIQFTDLDSQKWRLFAESSRFPKSWVYRTEASLLFDFERQIAQSFDYSLFCSARELDDFNRLIPGIPARLIRNGVDLDYFRPIDEPKLSHNLVFTGVMDYRPNVEGVAWFCREILPRVQSTIPDASITICGASPNKVVQRLASLRGVEVTGAVPDVRPFLARASIGVIPIRIARGIQNKLLEAMAMGLSTVATSAAQAGLEAENGRDLFVADEPKAFASAVVKLLQDEQLRLSIGQSARRTVEAHYRWEHSLAQLDEVIATVMLNRRPRVVAPIAVGIV